MKQIVVITFLLGVFALTVNALYIPGMEKEYPKLQLYKDGNYSIEKILQDLAKDYKEGNYTTNNKKRNRRAVCYTTRIYGGTGGIYFDDGCVDGITKIDIYSQAHTIRSIQATYRATNGYIYTSESHGLAAGTLHRIHFASHERIIAVVGRAGYKSSSGGYRVFQLAFLTNVQKHVFGPYGPHIGELFIVYKNVVSFIGWSGADLDGIGFRYVY